MMKELRLNGTMVTKWSLDLFTVKKVYFVKFQDIYKKMGNFIA